MNRVTALLVLWVSLAAIGQRLCAGEPPTAPESVEEHIRQLIERLGHDDYFEREKAQEELAKYSFDAFEALTAATMHEDLEIATRAEYLLRLMRVEWAREDDPAEVRKLLADYETQSSATKLARMRSLAALPDRQGVPALCRLVRFERSLVLSKHAAMELLGSQPPDQPPSDEVAELLQKHLAASRRTAAEWLFTYLRFRDDPEAVIRDWTKLVEAEHALLGRSPTQSSPKIVAQLVHLQIEWLKKLRRRDQAVAAIRRLADLNQGDAETLSDLLVWLIGQKAWDAVDELAAKLAPRFAGKPVLLYAVAEALSQQGQGQRAEQVAAAARNLNPGTDARSLAHHYSAARELQQRGLLTWARQEFRYVIEHGSAGQPIVVVSQYILAELLHDQGRELDAAKTLELLLNTKENEPDEATVAGIRLGAIRARMYYFSACHDRDNDDPERQREHLDKAIEHDPSDVDALIACYRLPDQTLEYRERIRRLIRESAEVLRRQIAEDPEDPTPCNQFAWLVGNTEGDLDEALRLSEKSIELSPDNGGYYDTLAHVYFAKGDYQRALQTQMKAAELEPHSGLIARQLEIFRKRWEEEKKKHPEEKPEKTDNSGENKAQAATVGRVDPREGIA